MEGMRKHVVVAAFEFGTTYAGLAYSFMSKFETDPLTIHFHTWRFQSFKTPTFLLLDKKKQFVAFGYDAHIQYDELVHNNEQDDYYFFDRFTMSLHNNENVTRDMVLKDKTGKQCSAGEVFTLSIKAVVDRWMEKMQRNDTGLGDDDVLWVLTVPAAWTDSGKQLTRESAEKAGLHSRNVLLITEPEAAFTYCHYLPTTGLHIYQPGIMIKDPSTKSMVVDLGDMTADITVLQPTYNGQLKELLRATADDCGGASVHDRFCKMLEEIVGRNVIAELKEKNPCDWLGLFEEVRRKTERLTPSYTNAITFAIPSSLIEICEDLHGKNLKSVIKSSSYVNEITPRGDKLRFKADLMIKLFTPTIDSIVTLMKTTVSNKSTNGLSTILMVGGFSKYPMIQEAVKEAFPGKRIIIPEDVGMSVLKGAVLFGHRPDYIRSVKGDSLDDDDDDNGGCIGK